MCPHCRSNGPYQEIEFPDHHYPNGTDSFPSHTEILAYLRSYAKRFELKKYIKFRHLVLHVRPTDDEKWLIIVKDLINDSFITQIYDAVFVCNGHNFMGNIPEFDGAKEFQGKVIHSHDFRTVEAFRGTSPKVNHLHEQIFKSNI